MTRLKALLVHERRQAAVVASLAFATALCTVMLIVRAWYDRSTAHFGLQWNLFLAWLPMLGALVAYNLAKRRGRRAWPLILLFLGLWLIFFPNECISSAFVDNHPRHRLSPLRPVKLNGGGGACFLNYPQQVFDSLSSPLNVIHASAGWMADTLICDGPCYIKGKVNNWCLIHGVSFMLFGSSDRQPVFTHDPRTLHRLSGHNRGLDQRSARCRRLRLVAQFCRECRVWINLD